MQTVELSPAYLWDCPECGRENFQRAVSVVLDPSDPDDAATIRDMHGIEDHDPIPENFGVRMQTRPDRVTCRHCGAEFRAADFNRAGGDDE